jgi:hypothetical protein
MTSTPITHLGDEGTVQAFGGSLAILRSLGDSGKQRRLTKPKIEIGDPLSHADVGIVRRVRMGRRLAGLRTHIQREDLVFGITLVG